MAILRVRDKNGNVIPIPAVKGEKGDSGVTVGRYVGDGEFTQYVDLGTAKVEAVLISCAQTSIPSESNVTGVPLNGALVTWDAPLKVENIEMASLFKPMDRTYLIVKNYTFTIETTTMRTVYMNKINTVYPYLLFTSKEGET